MEVFASTHHVMAIVHALLFESQSPYLHVLSNAHALLLQTPFEIEMIVFFCVFFTSFWFGSALFLVQISLSWMWFYQLQICCTFRLSAIAALIFECVCLYTDNIWIKSIISDILQRRLFYFSFFSLTHTCRSRYPFWFSQTMLFPIQIEFIGLLDTHKTDNALYSMFQTGYIIPFHSSDP